VTAGGAVGGGEMARKWIKGGGSARCGSEWGCLRSLGSCLLYRGT